MSDRYREEHGMFIWDYDYTYMTEIVNQQTRLLKIRSKMDLHLDEVREMWRHQWRG
jgi:hypothetical protein